VSDTTPTYIGRCKCGQVVFAVVDDGEFPKETAESAQCIRAGLAIERVTVAWVHENGLWVDASVRVTRQPHDRRHR
jgi:hypothetical protein